MDTKWKNKWIVAVWLLLFSHGLSGIITGLLHGEEYTKKDYFQTPEFQSQLDQMIDSLTLFELNYIPEQEAKKFVTVTGEEINEHRFRYGDLPQQIDNIKAQYEGQIQEAITSKNRAMANAYTAERDTKIKDITMNFQNDEYVRGKVRKEKEQKISDYYREIENQRADFIKYKQVLLYYLKDIESGTVYTNIKNASGNPSIDSKNMAFIRTYPSSTYGPLSTEGRSSSLEQVISARKAKLFEGQIAIPKSSVTAGSILSNYYEFENRQIIFYIHTISGIAAFLLSLYLLKKLPVFSFIAPVTGQSYYKRVPIDIGFVILAFSGLITLLILRNNHVYSYRSISEWVVDLGVTTFFVTLTLVQGIYFLARVKDETPLNEDLQKSAVNNLYKGVRNAFRIRRIGTQVLILLILVFVFGAGFSIVLINPNLLIFYAAGFFVIALPILILLVKRTGYFNQILLYTNEITHGNLLPDLPVKGKFALATLADNINLLKHGVKTSQKEQAKSERLKTELITNVSHDLRTPLTSIITYTELLKTPGLSEEDRNSYLEIVDRKSKRLKVLIDDLFEVSKMASGNVDLAKEKVDLIQLLQQALAEYNNQMNASMLQFRVTTPDTPVYAFVDGQKLWRVFDNLIGNILKYALENTRVYISIKMVSNQVVMTFKNVMKYELGGNTEELFERFKRGDTSRHTEGSGLGLAIAKSIIDLHEGSLEIEIDDDVFKVTVRLNSRVTP
ncbi:sensor histidine kinase [Aneurinibacillus tyrosinisolvens]|uniref:sensor histidine kinase n=1 Tax=Aneurinibacillus tyrosinisolvens TaxID=1443435 RepID=UPI00063EDF7E|nr:HAMP domain-containing sensor histidine kinase [Aneurinibacillus tyrosinisolvens]